MRKSAFIALGCGLMVSVVAEAGASLPFKIFKNGENHESAMVSGTGNRGYKKAPENVSHWKPTVTKAYGWTGKKWALEDTYTYTYDFMGNTVNELSLDAEGDYTNTIYEYDKNGKVTFKESKVSYDGGIVYDNYKKTKFEYDPILSDVITMRMEWLWMGGDWQLVGNNYKRIITRDEDGNITSVVIAVLFQGIYDPTQRLEITYGEDGKATSMSESILGYDGKDYYWEEGIKLSDIVWENTDGQIHDIDISMLFIGNNRIKTAHYEDSDGAIADVSAEYGEDGSYIVTMEGEMEGEPVTQTVTYTPYENYGFRIVTEASVMGVSQYEVNEEQYDEWGHLLLSCDEWSADDEPKVVDKTIGEVEFDEDGFPISYTVTEESFNPNTGDIDKENAFRAEYFDYVDVTAGVGNVDADPDTAVIYFNLQGMPVRNPEPGSIVIRKQGNLSEKIRY